MTSYSRQQATVMESLRCGDKMEHFCDDRLRKSCVTQVDRFMQIVDMNCEDVIVPTSAIHKYEFKEEVQEPAEQSACDNNFRHCKIEMDYDDTPITVVVKQEPTEEQSTVDPLTAGNQTTCDQTAGNQTACDQTACNQTAGDQTSCDQTAGDQTVIKKTAGDQTAIKKTGAKKKGPKKTAFKKTTAKETGANQTAVNQTAANQTAVNQTAANQTAVNQTAGSIEHYVAAPLVSQVAAFSHMAVPVYPGTPSNMCNHADIICGNLYGVCDCTVVVRTIDVHTSTATCWLVHNGIVQQDIEMTVPVCRLQEVPEVARLGLADRNLQVSLHGMPVESAMSRTTSGHSISEETSQYERNISRQNLPPAQKGDAAQFRTSQEVAACTSSSQPLCLASNNSALLHCMSKNVKHMPEDVKEIDVCGYPFQYIIHEDKIYFSCQDSFNICGIWKFVRNKGYGGIVTILNRYNCVDDGVFCVNMRTRWIRRDALLLLLLDNKSFPKSNKRKAVLLREVLKMKGSEAEEKVLKRKLEEACLDSEPPCRAKKAMMPNGVDLPSQMQDAAAVGLPQAGIYGSPYMGMEDRSAPTWQNINMTPVSAPILISPRVNGRGHLHPPASSSDHLPASGVRWTHVTVGGPRPDSAAGITPHSDPAVSEAWPDFAVGKVQEQEDSLDCTRPEVAGTRPDNANIDDSASPTGIQPAPSPAGIQPTPSPAGIQPTPSPTGIQPTPSPAGIQPTPSPTGIQPTPSPAGIQPAPSPAGIQPTPSKRGKSSDPSDAVSSQGMIELLGRNVLYKTHQGKIFLSLPPLFKELQLDKHIQNAGYSFIDRRIESSGLKKCDCFLTKDNLLRQRTHIWARAMLKILGCMKMGNKEKKMQLRYDILAALENMAASNSGKAFGQGQDKW